MTNITDAERRLVAIFAADVEGYGRLMGSDEAGTLRELTKRRRILDGLIASHRGRIANTAGDSVLVEFNSAVDAVQCAVEAQGALAEANQELPPDRHIKFRIGVHVGDVMVKAGDLFGDGVNIAARLQSSAAAQGICISGAAYDHVRKVLPLTFIDLGMQSLKNIEPIRAYAVSVASGPSQAGSPVDVREPLALPDKPSIAVLPFQNMSGDPEQEYFADGMVEDIITGLSRSKSLFVIARNSSFTYKGKAVDIKQVGRELGVRYVLEGSVRKAGNRVRISGQLIDAGTGAHLWVDRFDSQLEDIFDLQDRVAMSVIGAISPQLEHAEIERAQRKPTESLQAYDYYLRGLANNYRFTREANLEMLKLTQIARTIDPEFALSYALGAYSFSQRKAFGWSTDAPQETSETRWLARRAVELDKDDASVLAMAGYGLAHVVEEIEEGADLVSRAISRDPNLASARYWMGWINVFLSEVDAAIEQFHIALRLSPLDPRIPEAQAGMAFAYFLAGRYAEASSCATSAVRLNPNFVGAQRIMMACHAMAGRVEEARQSCALALQMDPAQTISGSKRRVPFRRPEDMEKLAEAFRIAGMLE